MQYVVKAGETPQQIASRFGKSADWQRLVLLNSSLGLRQVAKERGSNRVIYTFAAPTQGGLYRKDVKLVVPPAWINARTKAMVGVGDLLDDLGDLLPGGSGGSGDDGSGGGGGGGGGDTGGGDTPADQCGSDSYWDGTKCVKLGTGMPGAGCSSSSDCQNGAGQCVNGICQVKQENGGCAANGAPCDGTHVCCAKSTCQNGKCAPGTGGTQAPPCKNADGTCTADSNCCSGLTCQSGKCAPQPAPNPGSLTWLWITLGTVAGLAVVGTAIYVGTKDDDKKGQEKKAAAA